MRRTIKLFKKQRWHSNPQFKQWPSRDPNQSTYGWHLQLGREATVTDAFQIAPHEVKNKFTAVFRRGPASRKQILGANALTYHTSIWTSTIVRSPLNGPGSSPIHSGTSSHVTIVFVKCETTIKFIRCHCAPPKFKYQSNYNALIITPEHDCAYTWGDGTQ